ncbi:hypothetical protein BD779DRAFT_695327 [Infundibulicybe gibba]|nr:hypothetical protein BD779DRAFT_695327 [Infundibulicybe gibba]
MSFEDDSDLTSLSSDEETPTSTYDLRTKRQSTAPPRGLRPPRTVQYSVQSLYSQIKDGVIDLNPEYQRDFVWRDDKQIALIDSLFENYYIPPIVFCVFTTPSGEEKRTCIDGKQRLTSFIRFIDGAIPYKDSNTHHKYWYSKPKSKAFKLLQQNLKSRFDNKQIVCVEYDDITHEQEREIFQRVQMGVSLTPAERMKALNGAYATMIRDAQAKIDSEDGFSTHLNWENSRGRDFQTIAQILYTIDEKKEPTLARLERYMAAHIHDDVPVELARSMQAIVSTLCRLVRDPSLAGPLTQSRHGRLSPIEFVMIAYLIHVHHKKRSVEELSDAIGKMRDDVRTKHQEIRSSRAVYTHLQRFVDRQVGKLILKNTGERATSGGTVDLTAVASRKRKMKDSTLDETSLFSESDDDVPLMKARRVGLQKQKRVVPDDDEAVVVKVPPKNTSSISRTSISGKAPLAASKAITTVKRIGTNKPQSASTSTMPPGPSQTAAPPPKTVAKPRLSTNSAKCTGSQTAIPSVKPTSTPQVTKSSTTASKGSGSQAADPSSLFTPSPPPQVPGSAAPVQAPPARVIQFSKKPPAARIPRHRAPQINTTLAGPLLPSIGSQSVATPTGYDGPSATPKAGTSSVRATPTIGEGCSDRSSGRSPRTASRSRTL